MFVWNSRFTTRYPISRIEEIQDDCGPEGDREGYSKIFLQGDEDAIVRTSEIDAISGGVVSTIVAPAGYSLLHACLNDQGRGYISRSVPVIGFAVAANAETRPLTARGVHDGMFRPMPIEYPDGSIWDEASDCGYDDRSLFLSAWAVEHAAKLENDREHAVRAVPS
ncbi:hypothetical protein [Sphingomonas montana]|uniref:hypothetical protein n=1 Tax=Sphingomonas montana TaxID=1843236 RepID=UPI00096C1024|nr:hypothetical protein [Sphingomonas montana]